MVGDTDVPADDGHFGVLAAGGVYHLLRFVPVRDLKSFEHHAGGGVCVEPAHGFVQRRTGDDAGFRVNDGTHAAAVEVIDNGIAVADAYRAEENGGVIVDVVGHDADGVDAGRVERRQLRALTDHFLQVVALANQLFKKCAAVTDFG